MSRRALLTTASVASGATLANQAIPTPDDNFDRQVESIWATPQTAGVIVTLRKAGYQIEQVDAARFAAGNEPVEVGETWPATIQITVDVQNTTGGAVVPTIVVAYTPKGGRNG